MNNALPIGLSSALTTAATMSTAALASVSPQNPPASNPIVSGEEVRGLENPPLSCADQLRQYEPKVEVSDFPPYIEISDDLVLYFKRRPEFTLHHFKDVSIEGWDIRIPMEDFGSVRASREMARKFLQLLHKLERDGVLPDAERSTWSNIGSHIDYDRYCEDCAVPVYCQGFLRAKKNGVLRIEWLDQTESEITGSMAGQFSLVDIGEAFSCKVKFNDRVPVKIEDVKPLFLEERVDISWIQPFNPPH